MGWAIGYDENWKRDIGYGVPAECDHPDCSVNINRGLSYVCGSDPYGGEHGCGLHFCYQHLQYEDFSGRFIQLCDRCIEVESEDSPPVLCYTPKPDVLKWIGWKLKDESWGKWREHNPDEVKNMRSRLKEGK